MQDPLNCDLTAIDTTLPILNPDRMQLKIESVEIKPTSDNTGRLLSIKLVTTDERRDMKGNTVAPGHYLFTQTMLNPTGKATQDMVNRNLAELVQAARLTGDIRPTNVDVWYKQLEGRIVPAQVDFEPEQVSSKNGKRYDAKNVISRFLKQ